MVISSFGLLVGFQCDAHHVAEPFQVLAIEIEVHGSGGFHGQMILLNDGVRNIDLGVNGQLLTLLEMLVKIIGGKKSVNVSP